MGTWLRLNIHLNVCLPVTLNKYDEVDHSNSRFIKSNMDEVKSKLTAKINKLFKKKITESPELEMDSGISLGWTDDSVFSNDYLDDYYVLRDYSICNLDIE